MKVAELALKAEKLVSDNSPAILAGIGVVGTIATAYLTGKATLKATEIIEAERQALLLYPASNFPMNPRWVLEKTWKLYIPAAGSAALTVAAIITATHVGNRRAAVMAAAYTFSERAYEEYRAKTREHLGERKEQTIRDEIAQNRVTTDPVSSREVIIAGGGDVLCYEGYTGRYFTSSVETLKKAQNDTNYQIIAHNYASLSDFYERVKLPPTKGSDDIGWTTDHKLELKFSTAISDDQRPCIVIEFHAEPIRY